MSGKQENTDNELIGNYLLFILSSFLLLVTLYTVFGYLDYIFTNKEADARIVSISGLNSKGNEFTLGTIYYNSFVKDSIKTSISILQKHKDKYTGIGILPIRYYYFYPRDIYIKNYGDPNLKKISMLLIFSLCLFWIIYDSIVNRFKWL